jgi:methyl-accepting chemotaxis protein
VPLKPFAPYDGTNYFWINDMHPTMVMHPIKPELKGKDLSDFKDPSGRTIFVEMTTAARTPTGDFVLYQWPKPGSDQPVQKLSFVKGFEPWGWVIGTGIYVEDVNAAWRKSAKVAGLFGLSCLAVLLFVSKKIANSIFVRFQEMIGRIKDVARGEGDLTKRVEITSNDEVGELPSGSTRLWTNSSRSCPRCPAIVRVLRPPARKSQPLRATRRRERNRRRTRPIK